MTPGLRRRSASASAAATILRAAAKVRVFFSASCAVALLASNTAAANETANNDELRITVLSSWENSLLRRSNAFLCAVVGGDGVHLVRRQLHCDGAHLLIDVVLPHGLGERRELAFDVSGMLTMQRRRSELSSAGAVTGRAGRDAARGVAG